MLSVIVVLINFGLALQASAQQCEPLDVGCCVTIATDYYPRETRTVYVRSSDHWAYLYYKPQSDQSDQWKVKAKEGRVFQFESVAFPDRCLCEKPYYAINYVGSCECRAKEPIQEWELEFGEASRVTVKRPGKSDYLYPCKNGSCLEMHWKQFDWIVKPC
uniref:Hypothetical secreted protein n=1 Tax=Simulium nigrimanum TaxID=683695 RepID=D1FPY9_SIMNI